MQETFIIGSREFTCVRMNAFTANRLFMRIQKVLAPVLGSIIGSGRAMGDIDIKDAAMVISEHLDESVMDNIVLPLFSESRVYCQESKKFLKSATEIDMSFTVETLFDLYELIFEVGRYQFGPFFAAAAERFGLATADKTAQ